jgi:drug/metabolite transporter (DMT)-like permease
VGPSPYRRGIALCVLSACGFGTLATFAKEAYAAGVGVVTLLSLRFMLAAALFWAIVLVRGARRPSRRVVLLGLALGGAGYAAQAGLYFGALTHIDASLTALLLYIYPVLVFAGAVAVGREHVSARRVWALGLAIGGAALVLLGGSVGAVDGLGVSMAVGSAVVYATYILVADRIVGDVDPVMLAALVATAAAVSLTTVGVASGSLDVGFAPVGWLWIAALALGSTVAIMTFFAGLKVVGPANASIISTAEPVVTVGLATAIYAEALGPARLAGGALVLAAVILLQLRGQVDTVGSDDPADLLSPSAPAGALAHDPA